MQDLSQQIRDLAKKDLRAALSHPACPYDLLATHIEKHFETVIQNPQLALWSLEDPDSYTESILSARGNRAKTAIIELCSKTLQSNAKKLVSWALALVTAPAPELDEPPPQSVKIIQQWLLDGSWPTHETIKLSIALKIQNPISSLLAAINAEQQRETGSLLQHQIQQHKERIVLLEKREEELSHSEDNTTSRLEKIVDSLDAQIEKLSPTQNTESASQFLQANLLPFLHKCRQHAFDASTMEEETGVRNWSRWLAREGDRVEVRHDQLQEEAKKFEPEKELFYEMKLAFDITAKVVEEISRYTRFGEMVYDCRAEQNELHSEIQQKEKEIDKLPGEQDSADFLSDVVFLHSRNDEMALEVEALEARRLELSTLLSDYD